jgi:hypothetical protein
MIELPIPVAFTLYLLFCLAAVFAIWGIGHFQKRKKNKTYLKDELIVCEFCAHPYLVKVGRQVSSCPECTLFNKKNPPS